MKKLLLFYFSLALSYPLFSQCNPYFKLEVGKKWTLENFDGRDKSTGRQEMSVNSFFPTSKGFVARINSIIYDKKGKEVFNGEVEYTCEDGVVYMDMKRFVSADQLQAFGAYKIQMESDNLEMPNKLEPNMELSDGSITIKASNSPIAMSMDFVITDRKVDAEEEINVPAGTYKALKISSATVTTIKMAMSMERRYRSVQWYAEGVGMIRSESYDDKGKLQGYSVLSKID